MRALVGGVHVLAEHVHHVVLQAVHVGPAVGDVLLDQPPAGGHVRAANLRREQAVEGAGLLGGTHLAAGLVEEAALLELFDDLRTGGGGADAAVLALLAVVLAFQDGLGLRVLHVLGDGRHVGDEGAFRVRFGRRGLLFRHRAGDAGEGVVPRVQPRVPRGRVLLVLLARVAEGGLEARVLQSLAHGGEAALLHGEGAGAHVVPGRGKELHGVPFHDGRVHLGLVLGHL